MINIAKKRLPGAVISIIVYLSYCAAGWYSARSRMCSIGEQYSMPGWFANDVWAFFFGGLLPFAVYAVLSMFIFRTLALKVRGDIGAIRYGLNYAIIVANLFIFGFNFIYLVAPLASLVLDILLTPVVMLISVSGYLFYAFKQDYIDKPYFRAVVSQVIGTMITVYGLVALVGIITTVV